MEGDEAIEPHDDSHYVFQNDPTELMTYVYKEVDVTIDDDDKSVRGFVQAIDPVSGSVVLMTFEGETPKESIVIMGHSVKKITVVDSETRMKTVLDNLVKPPEHNLSPKEIQQQKDKVKSWMSKHRIPYEDVEGSKDLNIMNTLTLKEPYTADCCVCANEIVLGKIQGLIKAMPSDVESW